MTERYQFARLFGPQDAGDLRRGQYVPFPDLVFGHQSEGLLAKNHFAGGNSRSRGDGFLRNVYHTHAALRVNVRE